MVYWPPYQLKRLSKQVNLCLYRESQRNQFWEKYQIHDIQILKIFLKFYENFEIFFWFFLILWNMLVLKFYENFVIFWNFWNIRNWIFFWKIVNLNFWNFELFWKFRFFGNFEILLPRVQFTMGFKIPYDTGIVYV